MSSSLLRKRVVEGAARSDSPSAQSNGGEREGARSLSTSPVRKAIVRQSPWSPSASKALLFIGLIAFILRFALINEPAEVVYGSPPLSGQ